jgi:uncharacterized membrane protein
LDSRFLISTASTEADFFTNREARRQRIVWGFVASISFMIVVLIVAAPLALTRGHTGFASAIYSSFSYVCHQMPERSFHLAGHQFAVCSRCTGLYAGFAAAVLVYPLVRSLKRTDTPRVIWLILATVPLLADFSLSYFGIWQNNHLTRFLTGALLGAVAALFVVPGLIELSATIRRRLKSEPPAVAGV